MALSLASTDNAAGQSASEAPKNEGDQKPPAAPAGERPNLEIFYLKDENGKLVAVPGMSLADFERLYALDRKLQQSPETVPSYILQEARLTGAVGQSQSDRADLEFLGRFRFETDGWIKAPLKLGGAIVREIAVQEAATEAPTAVEPPAPETAEQAALAAGPTNDRYLTYDREAGGYFAWLRGRRGEVRELRLNVVAPVVREGESRLLKLSLPAATASQLELSVEEARVEARTEGDEIVSEIGAAGGGDASGRSKIVVARLGGELSLRWKPIERAASEAPRFVVRGAIQTTISGPRRYRSEATLKIDGFGGAIDAVLVLLPADMRLLPLASARYRVEALSEAAARERALGEALVEKAKRQELVEVSLAESLGEQVELRLIAESLVSGESEAEHEFAGFAVLGAAVQYGHVHIVVEGEWSLQWTAGPQVSRMEVDPELAAAGVSARFEYREQPFSLKGKVLARERSLSVEPTYFMFVEAGRIRLEGRLACLTRGAKAANVEIDLADWRFDQVGPTSLVNTVGVSLDDRGHVTAPLSISQAGVFELSFQAHRDFDPRGGAVAIPLPRPIADSVSPAVLYAFPAQNVSLAVQAEQTIGLTLEPSLAATPEAPFTRQFPSTQDPLTFRGDAQAAIFAAEVKIRRQTIAVVQDTTVRVEGRRAQVKQRFSLRVANEPLRGLVFDAPAEAWRTGDWKTTIESETPPAQLATPEGASEEGINSLRVALQVDLARPRLGPVEAVVEYEISLPAVAQKESGQWTVPLAALRERSEAPASESVGGAAGIETRGHRLSISGEVAGRLALASAEQGWRAYEDFDGGAPAEGEFRASYRGSGGATKIELALRPSLKLKTAAVDVEKSWVQTWLGAGRRRDRVVFALATREKVLRIELPAGVNRETLEASIDGKRATVSATAAQAETVEIAIPRAALAAGEGRRDAASHVLELWYAYPRSNAGRGLAVVHDLKAPRIAGAGDPSQSYWQLVCAQGDQLLGAPQALTAEMQWAGSAPFQTRRGTLDQSSLEQWAGASRQPPIPTSANHYLFSSLGPLPDVSFRVFDRRLIVLAVSGAVLAIGLLVIYLRPLRHPGTLFLLGVATVGLAMYHPEAAYQLAQAAAIGLALVVVAAFFRSSVSRRRQERVVFQAAAPNGRPMAVAPMPVGAMGAGPVSSGVAIPVSSTGPMSPPDSRRLIRDSSLRQPPSASPAVTPSASAPPVA